MEDYTGETELYAVVKFSYTDFHAIVAVYKDEKLAEVVAYTLEGLYPEYNYKVFPTKGIYI